MSNKIQISVTKYEAIVLFAFLSRFSEDWESAIKTARKIYVMNFSQQQYNSYMQPTQLSFASLSTAGRLHVRL